MLPFYRFAQVLLLSVLVAGTAHAAELGDAVVRSHIGQPLVADVELTLLADPGAVVAVRMAHADVYKGANISMNPVLSSVNMTVVKRDGRQYLHLTSARPVATENVNLFLELTDGGRRHVRTVTLWLTPDPTPAPPPPPPAPSPAAAIVAPKAVVPMPAPVAAPRPVRVLTLPTAPVAPATCPQSPFSADQIKQCAVMDEKNAALSAQIVDLEAKVRLLQLAIEGKMAAPAAPPAPVKAGPPPPPPPPKKIVKKDNGFPWLLMTGGVLLLVAIGAGVWFFLKRRKATTAADAAPAPAGVAWHKRLLAKLKRKPKVQADAIVPPAADNAPAT